MTLPVLPAVWLGSAAALPHSPACSHSSWDLARQDHLFLSARCHGDRVASDPVAAPAARP